MCTKLQLNRSIVDIENRWVLRRPPTDLIVVSDKLDLFLEKLVGLLSRNHVSNYETSFCFHFFKYFGIIVSNHVVEFEGRNVC